MSHIYLLLTNIEPSPLISNMSHTNLWSVPPHLACFRSHFLVLCLWSALFYPAPALLRIPSPLTALENGDGMTYWPYLPTTKYKNERTRPISRRFSVFIQLKHTTELIGRNIINRFMPVFWPWAALLTAWSHSSKNLSTATMLVTVSCQYHKHCA